MTFRLFLLAMGECEAMLENCLASIRQVGIPLGDVCVIRDAAAPEPIAERFPEVRFIVPEMKAPASGGAGYADYGTESFSAIGDLRWRYVAEALEQGHCALYCDIDIAWLRNPLPYLARILEVYDLAIQTEPVAVFPPNFCLGFFCVRPSAAAQALIARFREVFAEARASNAASTLQAPFTQMLEREPRYLSAIFPLPESLFPTGLLHPLLREGDSGAPQVVGVREPFIFHANWLIGQDDKIRLLDHVGAWHLPAGPQTAG
ncbi:putative nucleotide-diphospho-sugar transferase [Ancylobacter lacus]|uniref:putative nucleotide-diphospho-sugar transferase n=1 Tax=Ancylobacter lacus TaxID=2579970 RepID=UPI001BCB27EA|nr:putative nucleotide-diphospho-sugar transferase [Ancylobacter lacus]MBS7539670.1 hypothetical protein [Ancylobacter lacus]